MSKSITSDAILSQLRGEIAASFPNQKAFAEAAGIPYPSLHRYLKGEQQLPITVFIQMCTALGLEPATVFARAAERRAEDEA